MKRIIVVGGGFGGITAALAIVKYADPDAEVTLIDREPYQQYSPNLYELVTAEEELTALTDLKHSIAVPMAEIVQGRNIKFVRGEVTAIDASSRQVTAGLQHFEYDYLVLALGSTSNSYGIPGVDEFAIPMKSANDALRIRDKLEFVIQAHRYDISKQYIRVAVAGGGFAGVEVAAELQKFLDFVAWKNNFPREKIETLLIEGSGRILNGLDDVVARDVAGRLHDLGVRTQVSSMVVKAEASFLEFKNGERLEYDCLIWTAGVKANSVPLTPEPALDRVGRIVVDGYLHPPALPEVFILGDLACVLDADGRPMPGTIPEAEYQAEYVAKSLAALVKGRKPGAFSCRSFGYIIPVGGKWAVLKTSKIYIKGWMAYAIREFVAWRWFAGLIGPWKAFRLLYFDEKIYSKND